MPTNPTDDVIKRLDAMAEAFKDAKQFYSMNMIREATAALRSARADTRRLEKIAAGFPSEMVAEVCRARLKFPDPAGSMTALTEEVGELAKALLDEPIARIRAEAVQVAAMAMRIAEEGDPTLDEIRKRRGAAIAAEERL